MAERWVVNASSVILLGKAEVLRFLPLLGDELVVPAGVVAEVQHRGAADAGHAWLNGEGRKFIRAALPLPDVLADWNGGAGEAEVMARALAFPGYTTVLDERAARRKAAQIGVPVLGSLRVIVKAKERGLIPLARPALEKLRGSDAYVSDELIDRAIALAGEA